MNDPASLADYQVKVQQLRDNYLVRIRANLEHLRHCLQQARLGDAAAQQDMLMIIHRANGSGAVLGFAEISTVARALESLLRVNNARITAQGWHDIEILLAQLQTTLQSA